jgi:hypothetical protein
MSCEPKPIAVKGSSGSHRSCLGWFFILYVPFFSLECLMLASCWSSTPAVLGTVELPAGGWWRVNHCATQSSSEEGEELRLPIEAGKLERLMYKHKDRHRLVFILQTGSAECVEENIPGLHSSV